MPITLDRSEPEPASCQVPLRGSNHSARYRLFSLRAADLAARAALLEVGEEDVLVRRARAVGPAFIAERMSCGLVGRDQVGDRAPVPGSACRWRGRRCAGSCICGGGIPLEGVPHLDGRGRLRCPRPRCLRRRRRARRSPPERKLPYMAGAHELVVLLGAAGGAVLVAAAAARERASVVAGVVGLAVERGLRVGGD